MISALPPFVLSVVEGWAAFFSSVLD